MGSPSLHNDVDVRIFVEDVNDHGPRFEKDLYSIQIPENIEGGVPIIQVFKLIIKHAILEDCCFKLKVFTPLNFTTVAILRLKRF